MIFRVPAPDGRKEEGTPVMVLPENTNIHGYKVNYLTCGGMSVIYKAYKDNKRYVIKEVSGTDSRNVMSLIQEKAVLERLNHPGIMKVFDLFDEDGFYYMVSEFVGGVTADKKLPPESSGRFLAESVVREWALQIFDIFEYLHTQTPPVIYRDLKPKNIMVDESGLIKLIDFGIARTYKNGKAQDTEHMGSMVTASPEHYGAQTDARSDIYTIGATLHYLLSNGKTMECNAFDIPSVRLFNKNVTVLFASVIEKALELSPDKRFQTVAEMRAALKGEEYSPAQEHEPQAEHSIVPARGTGGLNRPKTLLEQIESDSRPTNAKLPRTDLSWEQKKGTGSIVIPSIPKLNKLEVDSAEARGIGTPLYAPPVRRDQEKPADSFANPVSSVSFSSSAKPKMSEDTDKTDKQDDATEINIPLITPSAKKNDGYRRENDHTLRSSSRSFRKDDKKSISSIFAICAGIIIGIVCASIAMLFINMNNVPSVVNWSDAGKYDGKVITVQGEIKEVYMTSKNNIYLYFSPGPDRSHTFRIGIFSENFVKFHCTEKPEQYFNNEYLGSIVKMKGKVRIEKVANDDIPQMFATSPGDIEVVQKRPGKY